MASQEDTDDLYADLYGGDGAGSGDVVDLGGQVHEGDEQDPIGCKDDHTNHDDKNDNQKDGSNGKTYDKPNAGSGGSFIPPPSSTQQQQQQQQGTGLQIKGSFIPPPAASAAHSQSDVRDLTPASHNSAQQGSEQNDAYSNGEAGGQGGEGGENRAVMPHEMPEEGKMFVGGLNWDTTEESLRRYFSQFGEIGQCTIMRDNLTGRSRGFAFLNFVDPKTVNTVMVQEHYLDGKVIDPKRAIPRPQGGGSHQGQQQQQHPSGGNNYNTNANFSAPSSGGQKLFVGGLPASITPVTFRQFFEQFGPLSECTCMMDRETGKPRGFGFLTYVDDASLQTVLNTHPIVFDGKEVDVKRAQSKNDPQSLQMRRQQRVDNPEINANTGYLGHGRNNQRSYNSNNDNAGGGYGGGNKWGAAGQMNPMMGGFDPAAMAQMYQSMGWGGAAGGMGGQWNPMAWQQMMASMGGAGGMDMSAMIGMGAMGNMSPNNMAGAMSPNMGNAQRGGSSGPAGDERGSSNRFQRGGSHMGGSGGGRKQGEGYDRERSPRSTSIPTGPSGGRHSRERSPNRQGGNGRYDGGSRNRY
ncbi:hypothetical protein NDA13_001848 [Ustilago tritici]|nr:hypothetical protein NDA13_001848 [Ustilago tritici]